MNRNERIYKLYQEGVSTSYSAKKFNLSNQRIRQIILAQKQSATRTSSGWKIKCTGCGKTVTITNKQKLVGRNTCGKRSCIDSARRGDKTHPYSKIMMVTLRCAGCGKSFKRSAMNHQISFFKWRMRNRRKKPADRTPFKEYCTPQCYNAHG